MSEVYNEYVKSLNRKYLQIAGVGEHGPHVREIQEVGRGAGVSGKHGSRQGGSRHQGSRKRT